METLGNNLVAKSSKKVAINYHCEICDYTCCKKYNWDKHQMTSKHKKEIYGNNLEIKKWQTFLCTICGKQFQTNAGLWKHKNKCIGNNSNKNTKEELTDKEPTDKELIMLLIKENTEFRKGQTDIQEIILEIIKNGTHNTINNNNNNNTNSHNKAFNLNFFLNETCKNAMNITDFVDSIKLQLNDLMDVGELGFVEGISKIIVKNLNNLDEDIRPVHCTDKKRETFYVKDKDTWTKEDDNKTKLRRVVKTIANKNIRMLSQFREKYPEYNNSSSKISDTHDKLVIEAMTSDDVEDEKIIKNISKVTTIREK
jgi:hypothetical protein